MDWTRYNTMLNINGSTQRERCLNDFKQKITDNLINSPSYKAVLINNVSRGVSIFKGETLNEKQINSLPDETFESGDYVVFGGGTYLITEVDKDDEIYAKGKIQLCNYVIKFQSSTGDILSYPCIDEDATGREDENVTQMLTTGSSGHTITLPLDEITVLLKNGQRFFVDNNAGNPKSFKVAGINNTSSPGLVVLTVKESERQVDDRVDLGVCDYFEVIPEPEPVEGYSYSVITCSNPANEISIGGTARTLTPTFYDLDDVVVTGLTAVWSCVFPVGYDNQFTITSISGTNKVKIGVAKNEELLGKTITANLMASTGGYAGSISLLITL